MWSSSTSTTATPSPQLESRLSRGNQIEVNIWIFTELILRLSDNLAWAKQPLVTRLHRLSSQLKVTIIYGSNSWISPKLTKTEVGANISIITIEDATHHVYADQFEAFNEILIKLVENGA